MNPSPSPVHPKKRLAYGFVGLLAGNAILLLFLLQNALRARAGLLAAHMGAPASMIPVALEQFVLYAIASLAGWLLIGLPTVLLCPARTITGLSWPLKLLAGAVLGPFALLAVFLLLGRGHVTFPASFNGTGILWAYSVLVSTVAFVVYAALLRREQVRRAEHAA